VPLGRIIPPPCVRIVPAPRLLLRYPHLVFDPILLQGPPYPLSEEDLLRRQRAVAAGDEGPARAVGDPTRASVVVVVEGSGPGACGGEVAFLPERRGFFGKEGALSTVGAVGEPFLPLRPCTASLVTLGRDHRVARPVPSPAESPCAPSATAAALPRWSRGSATLALLNGSSRCSSSGGERAALAASLGGAACPTRCLGTRGSTLDPRLPLLLPLLHQRLFLLRVVNLRLAAENWVEQLFHKQLHRPRGRRHVTIPPLSQEHQRTDKPAVVERGVGCWRGLLCHGVKDEVNVFGVEAWLANALDPLQEGVKGRQGDLGKGEKSRDAYHTRHYHD